MSEEEEKIIWNPDELEEFPPFLGTVVSAQIEESSRFGNKQLHIQVKPEDRELGGSGVYHEWYAVSRYKNSKWGIFIQQLARVGYVGNENDLVGKRFVWQKQKRNIGKKEIEVLLPIGRPEDFEEILSGEHEYIDENTDVEEEQPKEETKKEEPPKPPKEEPPKIDESKFEELKRLLVETGGMTEMQIKRWAQRKGIPTAELDQWIDLHLNELKVDNDGIITLKN